VSLYVESVMFYLKVPYGETELAKSLGAIWDKHLKQWVAYEDSDIGKIWRWFPKEPPSPRSSITRDEAWSARPPRTRDPKELMRLANIKSIPVKASGFGRACDSNVSTSGAFPTSTDQVWSTNCITLRKVVIARFGPKNFRF
jgi:hypothetical protein